MSAAWIYFINRGKVYAKTYLKEAQKVGPALPVKLPTLRKMGWLDTICLMQEGGDVSIKSTVMFAEFPIERITGLSPEAVKILSEEHLTRMIDMGGDLVVRGLREFATGFLYQIQASIAEIADTLAEMAEKVEIGLPMLACGPERVQRMTKPLPMLPDLKSRTFYRRFDYQRFKEVLEKQQDLFPNNRPKMRGQWDVSGNGEDLTPETPRIAPPLFPGEIESAAIFDLSVDFRL